MNCGEGPVLTHHARHLSRKVAAGRREHLADVGRPRGNLVLPAAGGMRGVLSAGSQVFTKDPMNRPQACFKIVELGKL